MNMALRCGICGNDDWEPYYDSAPYGDAEVPMCGGGRCTRCGAEHDEAVECCSECELPIDECECEKNEQKGDAA